MKMNELIQNHKADIPQKDYWFLCINKKNSSEIMVRGAKQINNWVVNINPSNILQINWKKKSYLSLSNELGKKHIKQSLAELSNH